MPQVHRTEVDGVPCFVAEEPGPARCSLVFRVGTADETLPTAGSTHLVEHLAMHAVGRTPVESNAQVDAVRTLFWAVGDPVEVQQHVRDLVRALTALPLERLELERRVLLTEASRRSAGAQAELLTHRFGPRTYGLRAYDELGLHALDADGVADWAQRRFTRADLALCSTVRLPDDLVLDLPAGRRHAPPEPHAVDPLPARVATQAALGLDSVVPRSVALGTAWRLLRDRLHDALRREHALVYDVGIDAERVGADARRVVLLTDPLPELRYRAGQLLVRTLEQVLQEGFRDDEVRADADAVLRTWASPGAALALADSWALDELAGVPSPTVAALQADQDELTADTVTAALREAFGTALLAVPDEVVTSLHVPHAPRWSAGWLPGRTFLPSGPPPATSRAAAHRLVVGADGVTFGAGPRDPVTVPWQACEAVLAWGDGARRLVGSDGFQVLVLPGEWQEGTDAVDAVDLAAPPGLVIPMGPAHELTAPSPTPSALPATAHPRRRASGSGSRWLWLVLLALSVVLLGGQADGPGRVVLAVACVGGLGAVAAVVAARRRG